MKICAFNVSLMSVVLTFLVSCATPKQKNRVIRVGVIGGMMRSGLWPQLAQRFETERGYRVEVALSGNRDLLADAFVAGELDLAAMHAGEAASNRPPSPEGVYPSQRGGNYFTRWCA